MLQGVEKLADAVAVTMGPTGRNVIIDKSFGGPTVTKDGVTVAKEIELEDRFENMGAKLVVEVAQKTSDLAGDGTTTATVLARAIFKEGLRNIAAGSNPSAIRRGIDKAVEAACAKLQEMAKPVSNREEVANVGAISANNDRSIGELLAESLERVGKDGVITVEEGKTAATTVEYVDGMQFDKGFVSPYFINTPSDMSCTFENALILLYEKKISNIRDLVPVLEKISTSGQPLLIIAEDVDAEALTLLVVNKLRGTLNVCAGEGSWIWRSTQGDVGRHRDLDRWHVHQRRLGHSVGKGLARKSWTRKKVVVDKNNTTIVEGGGDRKAIDQRVSQIRAQIEQTDSEYDKEKFQERLAKLAGGVAVISVGAETEADMKQKKARVEDALHATRAAVEEGILPGGGVALLRTRDAVTSCISGMSGDEKIGGDIVLRALEAPLRQIADNAGIDGSVVADEVSQKALNMGYDANKGEYVDMLKSGIIDPVKVVRTALANAASISGLLLTTEALVTTYDKDDKKKRRVEGSIN